MEKRAKNLFSGNKKSALIPEQVKVTIVILHYLYHKVLVFYLQLPFCGTFEHVNGKQF